MTSQPGACERLAQSRERLRQAIQQAGNPSKGVAGAGLDSLLCGILDALQTTPGTRLLGDTVTAWWHKQPLHMALVLAEQGANALAKPVARRHPYTLVLGASAAGALLVLARPWRWIPWNALTTSLLPQIMSAAVKHASPIPPLSRASGRHDAGA